MSTEEGDIAPEKPKQDEDEIKPEEMKPVSYPVKVLYCPECTLPLEYCEFMPEATLQRCRVWRDNNQYLLEQEGFDLEALNLEDTPGDKKRQKRGGRGNVKSKQKKEPDIVRIARIPRGKRKFVTRVTGLATFDINLKKASKQFSQKFSCGSSVSGDDEIIIQGDVTDDLIDLISETWNQIDEDHIEDLGEVKR
ncbi:density-regulated protein-like [Clavelina lepadiformis]|uniref:SUI1 domain-containing protein n=1 Tax=Clavelina lepadiformis TaxID=159417 RepID=A0ABP0FNS7_CLALP